MNARCINCRYIRTEARLRAGWAKSVFFCPKPGVRKEHLPPGDRLECFAQREHNTLPESSFAVPTEARGA